MEFIKKNKVLLLLTFISFIISLIWSILVSNNVFNNLDNNILNYIVSIRGNKGNFLYYLVRIFTEFAFVYFIIVFLVIILIIFKFDLKSLVISIGTLINYLLNEIIKHIMKRPRPDIIYRWQEETSYSFPSGHSMSATYLYLMFIFVILHTNISKKKKTIISILSSLMIVIIGITRLILSVHYFSDVIGGFLWGYTFVNISIIIYELLSSKCDGFKPLILKKLGKNNEEF